MYSITGRRWIHRLRQSASSSFLRSVCCAPFYGQRWRKKKKKKKKKTNYYCLCLISLYLADYYWGQAATCDRFSLFCFCLFRRSVCVYTRRRKKLLKFRLCNQRSSSVFIGWRHYVKMQLKSRWRWRNSRSSHTPSPPSWELKGLRVNSWSLHYSPPRGLRSWWSQLGRRTSVCVWSLSTSSIWDRRSSHTPRASRQQFRISISSSYTLQ